MWNQRAKLDSGSGYFTSPELLLKGALESPGGVGLFTGHPAWPVSGFFTSLRAIEPDLAKEAITVRVGHSPGQAIALLSGARLHGKSGVCVIPGQSADQVLPDILRLMGAGAGASGSGASGAVIVFGDWPIPVEPSPGLGTDSRAVALRAGLALLEPCRAQEIKDWAGLALMISRASGQPVGLRLAVGEALSGVAHCYPNHVAPEPESSGPASILPAPAASAHESGIVDVQPGMAKVLSMARASGVNSFFDRPQKDEVVELGFIAVGWAYAPLAHALEDLGLTGRFPVLKLGLVNPVDGALVLEFARKVSKIVVVEQGGAMVFHQVSDLLQEHQMRKPGEKPVELTSWNARQMPAGRQWLHPSWLTERMAPVLREHPLLAVDLTQGRLNAELDRISETSALRVEVPERTATFCAGCPHRETSEVLAEVKRDLADARFMVRRHKREPVEVDIFGSDGCMTLAKNAPFDSLTMTMIGPGVALSPAQTTGTAQAQGQPTRRSVVLMGDGAFFRDGSTTVAEAIRAGDEAVFIITDNKVAASAGLAPHAGTPRAGGGHDKQAVKIETVVEGMVPKKPKADVRIVRFNPSDRSRYRKLLESSILEPGVKILIADKECGLTLHRRRFQAQRETITEQGFLPIQRHVHVATEVCEFCMECTSRTGCPGLTVVKTQQGPKVQTDRSDCVSDGACHRLNACPAFEEVIVERSRPSYHAEEHIDLDFLPQPAEFLHASQESFRVVVAGVGGSGVTLISQMLARAGHAMGYRVQVMESRDPALRTGGAQARVLFASASSRIQLPAVWVTMETGAGKAVSAGDLDPMGPFVSPEVPYGKADLLVGLDLYEAGGVVSAERGVRAVTPLRTGAVIDGQPHPTVRAQMGLDSLEPGPVLQALKQCLHPGHFHAPSFSGVCERIFGHQRYTNTAMLGYAFQKGLIPVTLDALEQAVRDVVSQDPERNIKALAIGRKMAVNPEEFILDPHPGRTAPGKALRHRVNLLRVHYGSGRKGKAIGKRFRILVREAHRKMPNLGRHPQILHDLIVRLHDCILWDGPDYARDYLARVSALYAKDSHDMAYALTRAGIWNLARVMLVKDEVYVATLLTHPEKYRMDRKHYGVNPARGDQIHYRHYNRPEIRLFGIKMTFSWQTRDWQLRLLRGMKFLRKLPGWHPDEAEFKDWYQKLLESVDWHPGHGPKAYARWLSVISRPEKATGFKSVRMERMQAVKFRVDQILNTPPEQFEPGPEDMPGPLSGFDFEKMQEPGETGSTQTLIRPRVAMRVSLPIL
jgi:indolepyruvate ferredoxin oxidoreductase